MAQVVTVYVAPGCTLCRNVLEDLDLLAAEADLDIRPVDVTGDPQLLERYLLVAPVVELGRTVLQPPISLGQLRSALALASGSSS